MRWSGRLLRRHWPHTRAMAAQPTNVCLRSARGAAESEIVEARVRSGHHGRRHPVALAIVLRAEPAAAALDVLVSRPGACGREPRPKRPSKFDPLKEIIGLRLADRPELIPVAFWTRFGRAAAGGRRPRQASSSKFSESAHSGCVAVRKTTSSGGPSRTRGRFHSCGRRPRPPAPLLDSPSRPVSCVG